MKDFNKIIDKIMAGEKSLSYSSLRQFLESPFHFYRHVMSDEVTPAMVEGKLFHLICLEPEIFTEKYFILDDTEKINKLIEFGSKSPRSTKEYKEWKEEQIKLNSGKELVDLALYTKLQLMRKALIINPSTKDFMSKLQFVEKEFSFNYDGFKIRGFKDGVGNIDGKYMIDLKKVADAKFKRVKWKIEDDYLDMQAALYCYDENCSNYHLIFIDNDYNITRVKLSEERINEGFAKFERALREFTRCAEEDLWHCSYDFWNGGYINF